MKPTYRRMLSWIVLCAGIGWSACTPPGPQEDWAAEEVYTYGQEKMEKKDWLEAIQAFRILTLNHSGSDLVDDALYHLGEAHIQIDEYGVAVVTYRRLIRDFPQSPYADEGQYRMAFSIFQQSSPVHLTQDKTFEAIRELQIFIDEYPNSEMTPEAHRLLQTCLDKVAEKDYKIGHLYFKMHDWEASRLYLSEVLEEFPMSNWASKAQYDIAESYAREKKWEDAIDQYTIFVQSYFDEELQEKAKKRLEEIRLYYAAEARKMQRDDSPDLINGTTGTPALIKTPSNEAGSSTP
jgi:outer membrane protein assembly factor BamD